MNYKEIKKDQEQIKIKDESRERNRRCRHGYCNRPVALSSYWFCGRHNKLRGSYDDVETQTIHRSVTLKWD